MKNIKSRNNTAAPVPEGKLRSQIKLVSSALHRVICDVFGGGRPADRALSVYFRENRQCGSRDRQLISETVFGVFRNWGVLRFLLTPERRQAVMDGSAAPGSRELEQLIFGAAFLDRTDFPAIKLLARQLGIGRLENCSSYVGRCRELWSLWGVEHEFSSADQLPEWIAGYTAPDFPLEKYAVSLTRRPPMWLRFQTPDRDETIKALAAMDMDIVLHERIADAAAVRNARVNLFTLEEFRSGKFEVQDLASQVIGLAAAPKSGERWFDCCAGAGGKTLQLASIMKRKGTVVASDIRSYKLDDLRKRSRRAGFPNIMTREWNGRPLSAKQANFDGVLVDAPCSCSGVWRRNPDGCWTLKESEIAEMASLQSSILAAASAGVKPGGVLVYATCSIFTAENEDVVRGFLASHPDFVLEEFENPLDGERVAGGMLQVYPGDDDCDCMFAARMRRLKKDVF